MNSESPPASQGISRRYLWLWFAMVVLAGFLGSRHLNEPDEGRYAEIARETATAGNWLVPTLNGFEHFQKPPLLYWATALSLKLFGMNEWAARLTPALAALGSLVLCFLTARKIYGEAVAERSAILLAACLGFFVMGRLLTPDMLMTFWIMAAITALVHGRGWMFFIAMGLGFLTKGPMALVVPLAAGLGWQRFSRGTPDYRPLPWARGMLITLALSLSWFVALCVMKPDLFDYFWRYELVERFASRAHGRSRPFWFFGPVILAALLPLTPLLYKVARAAWNRRKSSLWLPRHGLLLFWVLIPILVLSLSGSKLPTYILPLLPALVMACAAQVRSSKIAWAIALPAAGIWLAGAATLDHFSPQLKQQASTRPLAELAQKQPGYETATIFTSGTRCHGFAFYLGRWVTTTHDDADIVLPLRGDDAKRVFASPSALAEQLATGRPAHGVIRKDAFAKTFQKHHWRVLGTNGDFLLIANSPGPVLPAKVDPPDSSGGAPE